MTATFVTLSQTLKCQNPPGPTCSQNHAEENTLQNVFALIKAGKLSKTIYPAPSDLQATKGLNIRFGINVGREFEKMPLKRRKQWATFHFWSSSIQKFLKVLKTQTAANCQVFEMDWLFSFLFLRLQAHWNKQLYASIVAQAPGILFFIVSPWLTFTLDGV